MQDILDRYCKEMEHAIEVLDPAEASKCGEELKNAVMSVPDVRGREIQETVLSAGRFFIVRVRATSPLYLKKSVCIVALRKNCFMNCQRCRKN